PTRAGRFLRPGQLPDDALQLGDHLLELPCQALDLLEQSSLCPLSPLVAVAVSTTALFLGRSPFRAHPSSPCESRREDTRELLELRQDRRNQSLLLPGVAAGSLRTLFRGSVGRSVLRGSGATFALFTRFTGRRLAAA